MMPQDRKLKGGFDYIYFQKLKYGSFILFGEVYDGFCVNLLVYWMVYSAVCPTWFPQLVAEQRYWARCRVFSAPPPL